MKYTEIIPDILAYLFILTIIIGFFVTIYYDLNNIEDKNINKKINNKCKIYEILFIFTGYSLLYFLSYLTAIPLYNLYKMIIKYKINAIIVFGMISILYSILVYLTLIYKNLINILFFILFVAFSFLNLIFFNTVNSIISKTTKRCFEFLNEYIHVFYIILIILTIYIILYCNIYNIKLYDNNLISLVFLGTIIAILEHLSKQKMEN